MAAPTSRDFRRSSRRFSSRSAGDIRNQYSIAYHPTNPKLDGTYRKLKVEVVAPDGGPLKIKRSEGERPEDHGDRPGRLHGKAHGGLRALVNVDEVIQQKHESNSQKNH